MGRQGGGVSPSRPLHVKPAYAPLPKVAPTRCAPGEVHHWLLASPNGKAIPGVCKHCFEQRDFPAASVESQWDDFIPGNRRVDVKQLTGGR